MEYSERSFDNDAALSSGTLSSSVCDKLDLIGFHFQGHRAITSSDVTSNDVAPNGSGLPPQAPPPAGHGDVQIAFG